MRAVVLLSTVCLCAWPAQAQEGVRIPTVIFGTTAQVLVNGGTGACVGKCTLSTPQDIDTGASPTFAGMALSGLTAGRVLFAGTAGVVDDDAAMLWDDTNKWLGLGTSPLYRLHADSTSTATSGNARGGQISLTFTPSGTSSATAYGAAVTLAVTGAEDTTGGNAAALLFVNNTNTGTQSSLFGTSLQINYNATSGTITNAYGGLFIVNNQNVGAISAGRGGQFSFRNSGATTVANAWGGVSEIQNSNASGTITTAYGHAIASLTNTGTIGTTYGFYVGDLTAGMQTNVPYSFYASDAGARNYFAGNVGIGDATGPSTGTMTLTFGDGTAPSSMASNTAGCYGNNLVTTVEVYCLDEGGSATLQTPHDLTLFTPDPAITDPWTYASTQQYLGIKTVVDMAGLVKAVEQLTGRQFVYEEVLPAEERRDWQADQDANYTRSAAEVEAWEARRQQYEVAHAVWEQAMVAWVPNSNTAPPDEPLFEDPRPPDPIRKDPPHWLADRLARRGYYTGTVPPATAPMVDTRPVAPTRASPVADGVTAECPRGFDLTQRVRLARGVIVEATCAP